MNERPLEQFALLSIATALVTMALKTLAWYLTGSVGLLSDALESTVNLAAALLAFWMLRLAARPPSDEHQYGLSKAEYFSAGIEGALIVLAAVGIVWAAVDRLQHPQALAQPVLGLLVNGIATAANLVVGLILIRIGRRRASIAVEADGRHLLSDVWTSVGVVAGVGLAALTGWLVFDPIAALVMAAYIVWTGSRLMRRSVSGLLDAAIPQADLGAIEKLFTEYGQRHGMKFHALRTRRAAARSFISFHMLVPDHWTVVQAHDLSEEIEGRIRELLGQVTITTHIEPVSQPSSYDDIHLDRP